MVAASVISLYYCNIKYNEDAGITYDLLILLYIILGGAAFVSGVQIVVLSFPALKNHAVFIMI